MQRPDFPNLFIRLAGSPPMRRIADELRAKDESRIHKQPWRERARFEAEIGARNVIYMLADCANGLFYVGEAEDLVARFRRGHTPIPNWTHYRCDPRALGRKPARRAWRLPPRQYQDRSLALRYPRQPMPPDDQSPCVERLAPPRRRPDPRRVLEQARALLCPRQPSELPAVGVVG